MLLNKTILFEIIYKLDPDQCGMSHGVFYLEKILILFEFRDRFYNV